MRERWPGHDDLILPTRRRDRTVLLLSEIAILRRLRDGQAVDEIALGLLMRPSAVYSVLYKLRKAFEVRGNGELLACQKVRDQLEE